MQTGAIIFYGFFTNLFFKEKNYAASEFFYKQRFPSSNEIVATMPFVFWDLWPWPCSCSFLARSWQWNMEKQDLIVWFGKLLKTQ